MRDPDYVVVGGGTAGCVLAARLTQDPATRVVLLEAGGRELPGDPLDYVGLWDSPVDWAYRSTPQAGLDGVVVPVPRGRVLGGSSAINSMAHVRAHPSSYDAWERAGATGWNAAALLPFLRRSEQAPGMDPRWRGSDGPMVVAPPGPPAAPGSFYRACYEAAAQAGVPRTPDGNGEQAEGIARTEMNLVGFARQSAADAYLTPAAGRPNLTVITRAAARRLRFDAGRCVGVDYVVDGVRRTVRADREVVLAAGAVGSPQLLMVSGIGPAQPLRALGIDVGVDLPGVGANLQDHPFAHVVYASPRATDDGGVPDLPHIVLRSDPATDPDLQLVCLHLPLPHRSATARTEPWGSSAWRPPTQPGYSVIFSLQRPDSRGTLRLASADPAVAPLIDLGYYADPRDLDRMVVGLRRAREIGGAPALAPWRSGELAPGAAVGDDAALRAYLRATTGTLFHLAGTCAIGTGPQAVVDPQLRVHGVDGLRVADASVMPTLIAANPNATVLAIAERAATLLADGP